MVAGQRAARRLGFAAALAAALGAAPGIAQDQDTRAPFITTPEEVVERMLRLARTGPDDYVIDLGSGDGRIVIIAARKFGARGLGVDLDAALVAQSRESAQRAGVDARVQFEVRDVMHTDLSGASVVTVYLLPSLIDRLQPKFIDEMKPGARVVTHAFAMKGWKPDRVEKVRISGPHRGQGDESTIYLWTVPAQARGQWRGGGWSLDVQQNFQEIAIEASVDGRPLAVSEAKLDGSAIAFSGAGFAFRGIVDGRRMAGELERGGTAAPLLLDRR